MQGECAGNAPGTSQECARFGVQRPILHLECALFGILQAELHAGYVRNPHFAFSITRIRVATVARPWELDCQMRAAHALASVATRGPSIAKCHARAGRASSSSARADDLERRPA